MSTQIRIAAGRSWLPIAIVLSDSSVVWPSVSLPYIVEVTYVRSTSGRYDRKFSPTCW